MKNWTLYRILLDFVPADETLNQSDFSAAETKHIVMALRRNRCLGAALCLFDEKGVTHTLTFGKAHLKPDITVQPDTVFRAASISKFVTGLGIMKLKEQGNIDLDMEIGEYLPASVMNGWKPERKITLRALMTHTAGIRDSEGYNSGIAQGVPLSEILCDAHVWDGTPGQWEYSNLGAGIAGVVMEAATGEDFETLMQKTVFEPLGITATYYPQKVQGDLADAVRILPRSKTPNFNAAQRRSRPLPPMEVDLERHYNLAHGNLCVSAPELARLGVAAMKPGFLSSESLHEMRKITVPFGERAHNLSQGLFTFVLNEPKICERLLYGHQGMAYGAVHGLFFDPDRKRGMALLTTGASEARRGVLADLNFDLMKTLLGGG